MSCLHWPHTMAEAVTACPRKHRKKKRVAGWESLANGFPFTHTCCPSKNKKIPTPPCFFSLLTKTDYIPMKPPLCGPHLLLAMRYCKHTYTDFIYCVSRYRNKYQLVWETPIQLASGLCSRISYISLNFCGPASKQQGSTSLASTSQVMRHHIPCLQTAMAACWY